VCVWYFFMFFQIVKCGSLTVQHVYDFWYWYLFFRLTDPVHLVLSLAVAN
jgi:hypothetical protein